MGLRRKIVYPIRLHLLDQANTRTEISNVMSAIDQVRPRTPLDIKTSNYVCVDDENHANP